MNLIAVIFFTILMGLTSFIIGMTPTWIHSTKDNLDLVSAFGAGLLVGALFLVVIPEGIETIHKQQFVETDESLKLLGEKLQEFDKEKVTKVKAESAKSNTQHVEKLIGQSLLFGFAVMFIIDKLSVSKETHMAVPISLSDLRNSEYSNRHTHSPTIGLIVHALADGIALGATFVGGNSK